MPPETDLARLAERVAALEALVAPPLFAISAPEQPPGEQDMARLRERFAELAGKHQVAWLPPGPALLTPELARALLRECVTVVKPGETLVIRVPEGWTPEQVGEYQRYADYASDEGTIPFRVLVVTGEELGVAEAPASRCRRCAGTGHTCENHPDMPWGGLCCDAPAGARACRSGACHCGGAGIPCAACCAPVPEDGTRSISEAFIPRLKRA